MNTLVGLGQTTEATEQNEVTTATELDPSKYLEELQDFDLTEAQKLELLGVVFSISRAMVNLGFSTELRKVICEQLFDGFNDVSGADADGVKSSGSTTLETPSKGTER
jgi:hypothetical protein